MSDQIKTTEVCAKEWSFDEECRRLAQHFLSDYDVAEDQVNEFAQHIQEAVEDWLRDLDDDESDELGNFMLANLGRQNPKMTAIRDALDKGSRRKALRIVRGVDFDDELLAPDS